MQLFDRYMNGAATNPDSHVLAYAGAQLKKGLDVAKKLGAENFGRLSTQHNTLNSFFFVLNFQWKNVIHSNTFNNFSILGRP